MAMVRPGVGRRALAAAALAWAARPGLGQRGIASLNDPCDCMQHHDYWMSARTSLLSILQVSNFAERIFDTEDPLHRWVKVQSCMYSPENEEAHRPTALSDCIPGFLFTHVVCMQHHIVDRNPQRVLEYASELARLLPWGVSCMDQPTGWPFKVMDVVRYYRRVRRVLAAPPDPASGYGEAHFTELAWVATDPTTADRPEADVHPYERADVCPAGSLPKAGACWVMGARGQSCRDACRGRGLIFRPEAAVEASLGAPEANAVVPRLLALGGGSPRLVVQHAWAAFECFVAEEDRFHRAHPGEPPGEGDWSYPICALACPCGPELPPEWAELLELVPEGP